jgi:hypothetical protein
VPGAACASLFLQGTFIEYLLYAWDEAVKEMDGVTPVLGTMVEVSTGTEVNEAWTQFINSEGHGGGGGGGGRTV